MSRDTVAVDDLLAARCSEDHTLCDNRALLARSTLSTFDAMMIVCARRLHFALRHSASEDRSRFTSDQHQQDNGGIVISRSLYLYPRFEQILLSS
jgi:hypothetical protein